MGPWANAASGRDVLVWSSKCARGGHGSDNPIVKSRGLIPASAKAVVDLVRDSDRVREYNKLAIGREDQMALTTTEDGVESSVHCAVTRCPRLGIAGEAKVMNPKGFVIPGTNNAIWGMQFVWPIQAEYVIVYVDADYQQTIVGRSARDYAWIMARKPRIAESDYRAHLARLKALGYDIQQVRRVPHAVAQ